MKLNANVRNVLIIIVLAAIVDGLRAGQTAANVVLQAVSLGFLGAFAWIASRLYQEHRTALYSLGSKRRAVLYGSAGVLILALCASSKLTGTGPGVVVWLALIGGSAYAIFLVYRSTKQY